MLQNFKTTKHIALTKPLTAIFSMAYPYGSGYTLQSFFRGHQKSIFAPIPYAKTTAI